MSLSWKWGLASVLTAAPAAIAFLVVPPRSQPQQTAAALQLAPTRRLAARLSWSPADIHRPFQVSRGSDAFEPISFEILARLEKQGDTQALPAALLLSGAVGRARSLLAQLPATPDALADLAACALVEGRFDEALDRAQQAIDAAPQHARALWNYALAAEQLGLWVVASESFHKVAMLDESGWSGEARERNRIVHAKWSTTQQTYRAAMQAGIELALEHRPITPSLIEAAPSLARLHLSYALRTAATAEHVRALRPVVAELDKRLGADAGLLKVVDKAARQNFKNRSALAAFMKSMIARYFRDQTLHAIHLNVPTSVPSLDAAGEIGLRRELETHGAPEDWMLALSMLRMLPAELDRYERLAAATSDVWYRFAAQNERASQLVSRGNFAEAERQYRRVIADADRVAPMRAIQAREYLSELYFQTHRVQEAQAIVLEILAKTRVDADLFTENRFLSHLGDAARFRYSVGLSLAALTERARREPDNCWAQRYWHESAALLRQYTLSPARMREELSAAQQCGEPLSAAGVLALADLIRLDARPEDRRQFVEAMRNLRHQSQEPEERAIADHIDGRVLIDDEPLVGERTLRAAIALAKKLPHDPTAVRIATYGYGILRTQAGQQRKFEHVLRLTEQETGMPNEQKCTLVVEVQDDRVTVAARDRAGAVFGDFARVPHNRLLPQSKELTEISQVAVPIAKALSSRCGDMPLRLYAGFPVMGRGGWLPDDIPWSYASGRTPPSSLPGNHLVVTEVESPAELGLPRLGSRSPSRATTTLRGAEATIGRVLSASESARFIEFETHGLMSAGAEDAAMLVLSPSAEGYALTASKVRAAKLLRHPVVILGACHAATATPFFRERWSLPHAFLEAGARAVIAAPVDLPDIEARTFFGRLSERILSGEHPALALRDERIQWLKNEGSEWVRSVLVFE